jgi:hypothetical protein
VSPQRAEARRAAWPLRNPPPAIGPVVPAQRDRTERALGGAAVVRVKRASGLTDSKVRRPRPASGAWHGWTRSASVGGHQRRGCLLTRGEEKQQVGDADYLEQATDGTGRADDRKRAILASEQGSRAEEHAKAAGIEEVKLAEVEDERPRRVADRGVERGLQGRYRGHVDLAAQCDARRAVQVSVDDLKRWSCGTMVHRDLPVWGLRSRLNRPPVVARTQRHGSPRHRLDQWTDAHISPQLPLPRRAVGQIPPHKVSVRDEHGKHEQHGENKAHH